MRVHEQPVGICPDIAADVQIAASNFIPQIDEFHRDQRLPIVVRFSLH